MGSIKDLMTESPISCEASTTIVEAAKKMAQEDVGPLPIVDGVRVTGIVTDRDIVVRAIAEGRDPSSTTIGEIASADLVAVEPDTPHAEALDLMSRKQVRRLPVVENGNLVGIVAQADIARALEEEKTGEVVQDISR